jgi:hypothetical protein
MEVDLELVTNLDKANKELKALKDNMVGIGDATVSVGKSMGTAFKSPSKDVEALTQTVKGLANNMKGFETLVNNISTSKSSAELVANFNKLVQAAEKTLSPIEAIEFKLSSRQGSEAVKQGFRHYKIKGHRRTSREFAVAFKEGKRRSSTDGRCLWCIGCADA